MVYKMESSARLRCVLRYTMRPTIQRARDVPKQKKIVRGYKEAEKDETLTESPTTSGKAIKSLIACVAMSGWDQHSGDARLDTSATYRDHHTYSDISILYPKSDISKCHMQNIDISEIGENFEMIYRVSKYQVWPDIPIFFDITYIVRYLLRIFHIFSKYR